MSHIYNKYSNNQNNSSLPLPNSPPYQAYLQGSFHQSQYDHLDVSSDNSDTTTTYVDNSYPYQQQSETKKMKKSKKKGKAAMNTSNDEIIRSHTSLESKSDLESQYELHNEKRWFSFLFSKEVPPVPSPEERAPYPWKNASILRTMMFSWLWPVLFKGYKRTLQPDDLWVLTKDITVQEMHQKFDANLNKRLNQSKSGYLEKNEDLSEFKWPTYVIPLALFDTFKGQYLKSCLLLALAFCCQSLSPLITRKLIDYVEYRYFGIETTYNKGIGYTIGSVFLIFSNGLLINHFFHIAMITGAQSKAVLTKAILLKSFKLSTKSRYQFPIGRITSLMSTDLARIDLAIGFQPLVICFPIPVIIAVYLLLTNIGVSSLSGIGLFFISLIICVLLTKKLFLTRETLVKYTDERISLIRELLNNFKVVKYYAWEMAYKLKITKIREKEMKHLFTIKVLRNFITAYAVTLPTLSSMISFITMWSSNRMKSAGEVFSSLSLFSILAQAIMLLPVALSTGADALIGFIRCRDFLSSSEFDEELKVKLLEHEKFYISGDTNSEFEFKNNPFDTINCSPTNEFNDTVIEVNNANFIWESIRDDLFSSLWDLTELKSKKKEKKNKDKKSNHIVTVRQKEDNFRDSNRSSNDTYFEPAYSTTSSNQNHFPGLIDINLTIKRNEFVIITGAIGSGKTSLLNALSGFMKLSNPGQGEVKVNDELILCSEPWIQNATVRENILFSKPYDPVRYHKVIYACSLEDDLAMLPARDHTEIGERGITLSGGQKARINLARAIYANANILLFDDVLSAVDSRVGKHIVDNLFNDLLKNNTRILATHQLSLVENADKVIFLNGDGTIDVGTVSELTLRNDQFKRLIDHIDENQNRDNDSSNSVNYGLNNTTSDSTNLNLIDEEKKLLIQQSISPEQDDLTGRTMSEEGRATNAISWDIYQKYISLGSGIFGVFAAPLFIFFVVLGTFCQLFTNTWLSYWIERRFPGKTDNFYVAFYVMFSFLTVIFTAIEFTLLAYMNNTSAVLLNVKAVAKILHVPMSYIDTTPMGRILNRFTKDTDSLDNEIGEQMMLFVFPLALIIGIVILCITYLPWFAIAVPFLGVAFIFFANFYQGSSREIKRLEATQRSLVYNNFNETLTGMMTIKAYKAESTFIERNDNCLNRMNEAYFLSIANQRWLCVHLDTLASMFALIICMLCITEQFNISASSTGLLLSYVIQIVGLLSLTVRAMTQVENEMNSVERLNEYAFHLPQEPDYKKTEFTPPPEWPPSGYIQFNNISLRYRPGLPIVLKNLNLNIYPGEKVGICGRTGAGKSSIMTALYRLTDLEEGSIFIDGLDINNMGLYDLRSRLSIIPQDPVLFQGSIRKNLDPFNQSTDEALWDALRRSGLLDEYTISRIKNDNYDLNNNVGYDDLHKFHLDQMVDDNGANFSLGERQLIALARSLVRNSKILILDEATSSVDYETDSKIQETISTEFRQCTILCIAHRLKTILNYDRIIVLDQGQVVEKDTPLNLFNNDGAFRKMCDKANIVAEDFE